VAKTVNDIPPGPTAIVAKGTIPGAVPGQFRVKRARITGDANYPTNGYPLLPSDFGFAVQINYVKIINDGSGDPATAPQNLAWFYDTVAQALELQVVSTGAELANGQDAHLCTCDIEVEGY
jgi:hypothetical protein